MYLAEVSSIELGGQIVGCRKVPIRREELPAGRSIL